MELQKINNDLSSLSNETIALCKSLVHVNQLSPFDVSDAKIMDWAKSIQELMPNVGCEDLKTLIDDFKLGVLDYDNKKGIQNIFIGLSIKFPDKYQVNGGTILSSVTREYSDNFYKRPNI